MTLYGTEYYCARHLTIPWFLSYLVSNDIQCIPREAKIPSSAFQRFLASRCSFSKVFAGPSCAYFSNKSMDQYLFWHRPAYTVSTQAQPHPARGTVKTIQSPLNWFCMVLQHQTNHNEYGDGVSTGSSSNWNWAKLQIGSSWRLPSLQTASPRIPKRLGFWRTDGGRQARGAC